MYEPVGDRNRTRLGLHRARCHGVRCPSPEALSVLWSEAVPPEVCVIRAFLIMAVLASTAFPGIRVVTPHAVPDAPADTAQEVIITEEEINAKIEEIKQDIYKGLVFSYNAAKEIYHALKE